MAELVTWRKITYPGVRKDMYMVSSDGRVKNALTMKELTPKLDRYGYYQIGLRADIPGVKKYTTVHRLVAWEFIPNPENLPTVDHIDCVKNHNDYRNLEWVSFEENFNRAVKNDLNAKGERSGSAIYTESQIRAFCEKFEQGWTIKEVFNWYTGFNNVRAYENTGLYQLLRNLKHKRSWSSITSEYEYSTELTGRERNWHIAKSRGEKYSEELVHQVCQLLEKGLSVMEITEQLCGSRDRHIPEVKKMNRWIRDICDGHSWTSISSMYNFKNNSGKERWMGFDENICRLVDAGYNKKEIRKAYGLEKASDNKALSEKINRMINRYNDFKAIKEKESIIEIVD